MHMGLAYLPLTCSSLASQGLAFIVDSGAAEARSSLPL